MRFSVWAAAMGLAACGGPAVPVDSGGAALTDSGLFLMKPGSEQNARSAVLDRPFETFTVNDRGFRDSDFGTSTGPVFLAGDSIVFGTGLWSGDTLDKKLEAEFARRGAPVQVFNLGVPGYNLESSIGAVRLLAPAHSPRAVVYFFGPRDDLVRFDVSAMMRLKTRHPVLYRLFLPFSPLAQRAERTVLYGALKKRRLSALLSSLPEAPGRAKTFFFLVNPDAELVPLLSEAGVEVVWDDFSACGDGRCFIPGDGHPTAFLNEIRARVLAERIRL